MATRPRTGHARFTRRFTQAQKDAILEAVLVDGHTVRRAQEMAKAGLLKVPAFTIGNYAYDIVRDGRETFEERNEDALTAAVAKELRSAELDALANLRAIRRGLKRDGADNLEALRKAAQSLSAVRNARKATTTQTKATPKAKATVSNQEPEPANTPPSPSVVTSLLNLAENGARSASISRAPSSSPPADAA